MTKQEECKHEGQDGTYCVNCGKQLGADPEVSDAIRREARRLLKEEYGLDPKPPKKPDGQPAGSGLADKIFGSKKKKDEK